MIAHLPYLVDTREPATCNWFVWRAHSSISQPGTLPFLLVAAICLFARHGLVLTLSGRQQSHRPRHSAVQLLFGARLGAGLPRRTAWADHHVGKLLQRPA